MKETGCKVVSTLETNTEFKRYMISETAYEEKDLELSFKYWLLFKISVNAIIFEILSLIIAI